MLDSIFTTDSIRKALDNLTDASYLEEKLQRDQTDFVYFGQLATGLMRVEQ